MKINSTFLFVFGKIFNTISKRLGDEEYIYYRIRLIILSINTGGRRGRDRIVVGFTTIPMQSVPITTDVVSLNLTQGEVYNIM